MLEDWISRKKEDIIHDNKQHVNQFNSEEETPEPEPIEFPMEMNQYVVRGALEALHFAYGALVCPENPCKAYYTEMWGN